MDRALERVVQEAVSEMVALCPWMKEADVARVETVFTAHMGLVAGDEVDVAVIAATTLVLAQRAEVVGDRRRAWAFEQWYQWACAAMRGEEYHELELPPELAALP
jgi:hypothetical protein